MSTHQIYPGITLYLFKEERFKHDCLSVNFLVPSSVYDPAHASLLASVMRLATAKHTDVASLNRALEEAYDTSVSIKPTRKYGVSIQPFSVAYLNDRFLPEGGSIRKTVFDLIFEIMLQPLVKRNAFKKELVDNERKNLMDAMKAEKNNKPRYALRQCLKMICPEDYFARDDTEKIKDLRAVTATSLYDYYKKVLNRSQIVVFYFGRTDEQTILSELRERFAPLFSEKIPYSLPAPKIHLSQYTEKTEQTDAGQSVLVMGYQTDIRPNSPLYPAQMLLKELLADAPTSLLFMNVREKESLCYFCSSYAEPASGIFLLYSGIDRKNKKTAESCISAQIKAIQVGDFSDEQLESARKSKIGVLSEIKDSPGYTAGWLLSALLIEKTETPEEMIARLETVTKEEIVEVARHLKPECTFFLEGVKRGGSRHA